MTSTRSLRLGSLLTLALAASLGMSTTAFAQATKTEAKAKAKEAAAKEAAKDPIDLNSATAEELQTLPGIGGVTARKIIDSRPHKTVGDLSAAGVPASTIEKIKPLVEVKALPTQVDVNSASVDQLETLPGIGAVLAKEIVAARPLASYDDLGKLKGIGAEKLDGLKGRVKFGELSAAVAKAKAKTKEVAEIAKDKMAKTEEKASTTLTKVGEKARDTITKAEEKAKETITKAEAKTKEVATKVEAKTKETMTKAEEKAKTTVAKAEETTKEKAAEAKTKADEAKEKILAKIAAGTKVNINTANFETLDALPGIGPVKAQAILDARAEKKFEKIEDIMTVKGIKEGEFGKIKDMITVK